MEIQLIHQPFSVELYGLSAQVPDHNYAAAGMPIMTKMWEIVKSNGLKNKGINYWVYDQGDMLFTGVELETVPPKNLGLEYKKITLPEYAYWKHIGNYSKLKEVYPQIENELKKTGRKINYPSLEKYGHWTPDESKLETEILTSFK